MTTGIFKPAQTTAKANAPEYVTSFPRVFLFLFLRTLVLLIFALSARSAKASGNVHTPSSVMGSTYVIFF